MDDAAAEYKIPEQYPGYISTFLGGIKNNIQVAYNELAEEIVRESDIEDQVCTRNSSEC